jgi:hypothetical protein
MGNEGEVELAAATVVRKESIKGGARFRTCVLFRRGRVWDLGRAERLFGSKVHTRIDIDTK